jgi:hypothetical protein
MHKIAAMDHNVAILLTSRIQLDLSIDQTAHDGKATSSVVMLTKV